MYADRIKDLKSSAIRDILKLTARPGMISLAGGLPAPELFPLEALRRLHCGCCRITDPLRSSIPSPRASCRFAKRS